MSRIRGRRGYDNGVDIEYNPYDYEGGYRGERDPYAKLNKIDDYDDYDLETAIDPKDISVDTEEKELDAAAEFIRKATKYDAKPKKSSEEDDDGDDYELNKEEIEKDIEEEDNTTYDMANITDVMYDADTDMFYGIIKSRLKDILSKTPEIEQLDFTNVDITGFEGLKARIEKDFKVNCIYTNIEQKGANDGRLVVLFTDLVTDTEFAPDMIPEILMAIEEKTKGEKFTLKYDVKKNIDSIGKIMTLACISLTLGSRVHIQIKNIGVAVRYNKAVSLLLLPTCSNATTIIADIYNHYKTNYKVGQLVVACETLTTKKMVDSSYAGIITGIYQTHITIQRINTVDIIKGMTTNRVPTITSIYYNDINVANSLIAPIELSEECPDVLAALRHPSFAKTIGYDYLSIKPNITPNLCRENLSKTYQIINNDITSSDRDLLESLKAK